MAFKVKTTAPKIYCVRPNAAIVEPGKEMQIQVILLGLSEEPASDFKCKDKFLLITLPSPYDLGETTVAEAWPQLEAEFKQQAVSKKIKVKYLLDSEPRDTSVAETATADYTAVQADTTDKMSDRAPAAKPAASVGSGSAPASASEKGRPAPVSRTQESGPIFNPALLLLVALIALVLGWLYY